MLAGEALVAAGASLRENGFVLLEAAADEPALVDAALCDACAHAAVAECQRLLTAVRERFSVDTSECRFHFAEICHRLAGGRRYDLRVDLPQRDTGNCTSAPPPVCWERLRDEVSTLALTLIGASSLFACEPSDVRVDMQGCVISFPGACAQQFHPDGPSPGILNCFVPLVDCDGANGSTELQPTTHNAFDERALEAASRETGVAADMRKGSILLFDFRTRHRGRAHLHSDAPRPVAYVLFAAPGVADSHNFPQRSVWDGAVAGDGDERGSDELDALPRLPPHVAAALARPPPMLLREEQPKC